MRADISRSSIVTSSKCPRRFYYNYYAGGTGYVSPKTNIDLVFGIAVHAGFEKLLTTGDLEEAVGAAKQEWAEKFPSISYPWRDEWARSFSRQEHESLAEALLRGWYRLSWGDFVKTYEILSVEEWAETMLDEDIFLLSRWDFLVRDRVSGIPFVGNLKTTADFRYWPSKWEYDVQMWTETLAAERKLREAVLGCLVIGMAKGRLEDGVRHSPLIHPYRYVGTNGRKFDEGDVRVKGGGANWKKGNVWELEGGVRGWVEAMPLEDLVIYFQTAGPITKNDELTRSWLDGVVYHTRKDLYVVQNATEEEQLLHFRQNVSDTNCAWCSYRQACLGGVGLEDMVEAGHLTQRDPAKYRPVPTEE